MEIEASKAHWTELLSSTSESPDGESNEQVFERLQKGTSGRFFKRMDDLKALGEKLAEGGQAEIFLENQVEGTPSVAYMGRTHHVLKVFKDSVKPLRDLLREVPPGMREEHVDDEWGRPSRQRRIHRCNIVHILLLKDGRLAFRIARYSTDLRSFIDSRKKQDNGGPPFTDDVATLCMLQIAMAMQDLHNDNVIHSDLKASNVLISNTLFGCEPLTREYPLYCWVADYECSVGVIGTRFWRAPEILLAVKNENTKNEPINPELFTKKSDVYSYAMTCYEILTGLQPFQHEGYRPADFNVVILGEKRPKLPTDIKPWIKELLNMCWHQDPAQRPTFVEIVNIIEKKEPSSKDRLLSLWRN